MFGTEASAPSLGLRFIRASARKLKVMIENIRKKARIISSTQAKGMSVMNPGGEIKELKIPFMKGDGPVIWHCGHNPCRHVLADGVGEDQIKNLVFECPKCGMLNLVD